MVKAYDYVSWPEASFKCAQMGMELVSIHSEEENQFVKDCINNLLAPPSNYARDRYNVWLGLQKNLEGMFRCFKSVKNVTEK